MILYPLFIGECKVKDDFLPETEPLCTENKKDEFRPLKFTSLPFFKLKSFQLEKERGRLV